ncbi:MULTISPECIES: D-lactate dehydrogenase [Brucella]|jgi:D-lactate dehydrogenase|uniref:D-lactate dehydrogenase n=1 Tax=Brucella TaxID=234 RepID=UPI000CFB1068|nr:MULTISPECIES: D-lactate dehydrogenase [Brucella]MQP42572.1 D-lactate dehydrogenase [Ochrobactrum sp. MYb237]PQZ40996.1 D-lactate dehydrogenase [Brucella pseudogrignonensis]PRA37294.1 D-lactate dehydrogenase [Brucella pseudogrignonensis]PRA62200.1 D-lactate dehydrogenase [Brucella pseudogrignonensis]
MPELVEKLRDIVGRRYVLTGDTQTRQFRRGYRYGGGDALAVVRPGTLLEMWRALQACHKAGTIIIFQAANTGLTGGSTPVPEGYDRPAVIINTMRIRHLNLISNGTQVVAQPGVTLDQLEKTLRPIGREPHSVIGSSCIGASVTGGICNNSGGSLIRRGPAYTELALFAQIDRDGDLKLVNHLGIELGEAPEDILTRLDSGAILERDVVTSPEFHASDHEYCNHVRDISASTPARYNADPRRLYEASGSAGKVAVFALRIDTFPADDQTQVFYIGTNDSAELENIRRDILSEFANLPIAGEYMHRSAYDLSRLYGKDLFLFVKKFGTDRIPKAFGMKSRFDGITEKLGLGNGLSDRILQLFTKILPEHLPQRLNEFRDRYEHHLLLKMGNEGIEEARRYLTSHFPTTHGAYFDCNDEEGRAAFLNRFAVGGAVVRYRAVHPQTVEDIVALDIALPRNTLDWFEQLPAEIAQKIDVTMYCGHFFCHVLHQEYLVKKGEDCSAIKETILKLLQERGAKYPAEHNVGHLYHAEDSLRQFYQELDPKNSFNPGIGGLTKLLNWQAPGTQSKQFTQP